MRFSGDEALKLNGKLLSPDAEPKKRNNDLYVFAHYNAVKVENKEDILDLKNWNSMS